MDHPSSSDVPPPPPAHATAGQTPSLLPRLPSRALVLFFVFFTSFIVALTLSFHRSLTLFPHTLRLRELSYATPTAPIPFSNLTRLRHRSVPSSRVTGSHRYRVSRRVVFFFHIFCCFHLKSVNSQKFQVPPAHRSVLL